MNECMLSIMIPTFNHEKYIVHALDSVLMQKTKYSFEVLVGEDASTDRTRLLLQEYELNHPGVLQIFYREKNMSNSNCTNQKDLLLRCKGKYIISLEGDDYWISDTKIEEQINFLEAHPDYIAVSHNCCVVDENDNPTGEIYPECKHEEYTARDFLLGIMPGQLTTVMSRNYQKDNLFDTSIFNLKGPGDRLRFFALITNGKVHCMQKTMSAYRHIVKNGSSYSANYKYEIGRELNWYKGLLSFARNQKKGVFIVEALLLGTIIHGFKNKLITWADARDLIKKEIKHPVSSFWLYSYRMLFLHAFNIGN